MMDRRTYAREYARKVRFAKWAAAAEDALHCPANLGRGKPCRAPLENRKINGVTVPFCPQCDRKRRGICIDCKREPVAGSVGKALRCAMCQRLERGAAGARFAKRHPAKIRKQWARRKQRLQETGEWVTQLERKKLWRLANPERVKRQKLAWNSSATAREYQKQYRARMAEKRRERERERARLRRRGCVMTHPCVACGVDLVGRQKKCWNCLTTDYKTARKALLVA